MKKARMSHIAMIACAVFAAAVLFVTYGTVLPAAPFAPIQFDAPTVANSDGTLTVVADTESRRALIMNADGDLTGVVSCTTADSPIDAITDVCVADGSVYMSGVRFAPDSDIIDCERVAKYDKGGNFMGVVCEMAGTGTTIPAIKSLNEAPNGVIAAYTETVEKLISGNTENGSGASASTGNVDSKAIKSVKIPIENIVFAIVDAGELRELDRVNDISIDAHDAAISVGS